MNRVRVERLGGLAGIGGPRSRLASRGELDPATLSDADRQAVANLFARGRPSGAASQSRDAFRYRITRTDESGEEHVVEAAEHEVPDAVRDCVRDELV